MNTQELSKVCRQVRRDIITMTANAGSGHPGGSLSIADTLAYLYFKEMKVDPANPKWEARDRFVLSKGHAAPALYGALAQKGCRVFLPGGLLRPQTEAIIGAAALTAIQQYNFTKAFMGANGVALGSGFTTPDPEEAAVKAAALHRAREAWFLVDDTKFAQVYPAVICDLHSGAILTNRCPNPKYRQYTLIKETEV